MQNNAEDQLLRNTIDSNTDMVQVFKAVRDERGNIVDFIWILNNKASEQIYGDVIGKSLLDLNPGVVKEGIFETFKRVAESGESEQRIHHYVHEQFDGWFHQSTVKQGDGVTTTTKDITKQKEAEDKLRALETFARRENFELELKAVEYERQRIAENLHDSIGQLLFATKLRLINSRSQKDEKLKNEIILQAESLVSDAIDETRRISHQLMPGFLHRSGLRQSLKEVCQLFEPDIHFVLQVTQSADRFDNHIATIIFRIAQELITNAAKHSACTTCRLSLGSSNNKISLSVQDNGNGTYSDSSINNGIGLRSIISRIELLNGTIKIKSEKDIGTSVHVEIPTENT